GLPRQRQAVRASDHRFALGNSPAHFSEDWAERAGQKIVHQRQLANLGVQRLHIDRRLRRCCAFRAENASGSFQQLGPPGRDLVRMNVKLLRQLRQRLLALHGSQRHLRLECRAVVPAWSSAHVLSCHAAPLAAVRQNIHLSHCAVLPGHLCLPCSYRRCIPPWAPPAQSTVTVASLQMIRSRRYLLATCEAWAVSDPALGSRAAFAPSDERRSANLT